MKRIIIIAGFYLILGSFFGKGQNVENKYISPEFKTMVEGAKECAQSNDENCEQLYRKIIKKGIKDKVSYMDYIYLQLGFYFYNNQQIDSAIFYAEKAIDNINFKDYDYDTHAAALNLKGTTLYAQGDFTNSIDYMIQASKVLEENKDSVKLAYSFVNIGVLLGVAEDNEKSLAYQKKAHGLLTELKDSNYLGTVTGNIALKYFHIEENEKAKKWAHQALRIDNSRDSINAKATGSYVLTMIYDTEELPDSAYYYGKMSLKYSENLSADKLGGTLYIYAAVLQNMGRTQEVEEHVEESIRLLKESGNKDVLMRAYGIAAEIYTNNKKFEKAAEYYAEYKKLQEEILPEKTLKLVNELNTKFETEKKEKQIAEQDLKIQKQRAVLWYSILGGLLLASVLGGFYLYGRRVNRLKIKQLQKEKENAILSSFIQGEERERNRISHELHDGVAAMIGAAKMSLDALPHLSEEKQKEQLVKVKSILENTHADVRHIAHNLLPVVLEKDGIIKAAEQFASEINDTKLIKITVKDDNSEADKLSKQLQLMLFRIIQELVNNIIKHSQAETAVISFSKTSEGLNIEVTDDGIGYDGSLDSDNQGLYSITQRLKSIGGNFKFIRRKEKGMRAIAEVKV